MKAYIITSARYEECYIKEWVKYNLEIGFDKIIINDNNPKDYPYNLKDILKEYIDKGQVIVERYYDEHELPNDIQTWDDEFGKIYTWLYDKYKDEFDWFAKLDIDEFIEIPETNNNIKSFLQQDKFNNALSIIIPWKLYSIKDKYSNYYTRLKYNKDRYTTDKIDILYDWMFKSIIKKTEYVDWIGAHWAEFKISYNNDKNLICYALPDGKNASLEILFNTDVEYDIMFKKLNQKLIYINKISCICHINHYNIKSDEELCNKAIKFDADIYNGYSLHDFYVQLTEQHPDMFEHPRDLYKLYFIDNINNIQED